MAIGLAHEEYRPNVGRGLRDIVLKLDQVVGNSTWRSTATDSTSLKNLIRAQQNSAAIHECEKTQFEIAIRRIDEMVRQGILDNADIAAMNDLATSRGVFEAEDATLTGMK